MKLVTEQDLVSAVAIPEPKVPLSREQKLLHWASLVRASPKRFMIYHGLEYASLEILANVDVNGYHTAFAVAVQDPVLQGEGLGSEANLPEIMKFMDITQKELHEFSCDCGGDISNELMAERIEHLANQR
jgi:hypothetical protein